MGNNDIKTLSLRAEERFLDKHECRSEARRIIKEGLIDGMNESQLAGEIYFHAVVYHICRRMKHKPALVRWIERHADPIDICSGGDYLPSRALFAISLRMPSLKKRKSRKDR